MNNTVERKIADVASKIDGYTYLYEGYAGANERIARMELPCILNVLPETGSIRVKPRSINDSPDCVICFIDKMDFDFDAEQTDCEVVERLKRAAYAFIHACNESGYFKPLPDDIPYRVMFDQMDDNLAIVAITTRFEEVQGVPVCSRTTTDDILNY